MTTCETPPTHQTTEGHVALCREHASQAKREGVLVEIRPAPEPGGRRKVEPASCQHVEPEETANEPELETEPNEGEGPDS